MTLVREEGRLKNLNSFIYKCCINGNFHFEKASDYKMAKNGYSFLTEDRSLSKFLQYYGEADEMNLEILEKIKNENENYAVDNKALDECLNNIEGYMKSSGDDVSQISEELKNLEKKKEQQFNINLDSFESAIRKTNDYYIPDKDREKSKFLTMRFGTVSKEDYEKLNDSEENPFVYFIPCIEKGKEIQGIYVVPKKKGKEMDEVFSTMSEEYISLTEDNPFSQLLQYYEAAAGSERDVFDQIKSENKDYIIDGELCDYCIENTDEYIGSSYEYISNFASGLEKLTQDKNNLNEQKELCRNAIAQLSAYKEFDVDINSLVLSKFLKVRLGHIPKSSFEKLSEYDDNPFVCFIPCSETKAEVYGIYIAPRKNVAEIDRIFSLLGFERNTDIPGTAGTASSAIENLRVNIGIIYEELKVIDRSISDYWSEHKDKIAEIYAMSTWLYHIYELRKNAVVRNGDFRLIGWVEKENAEEFRKNALEIEETTAELSDYDKSITAPPPTKLKTGFLAKPYEMFVEMYGLPSYDDLDITGFVAITYTILFGMMFGDLGQGLILAIAGWLGWKIKKIKLCRILVPCGVSAMIFGFIYGSFFGFEEALDGIYEAIGMKGKPIPIMDSINTILILSVGVGVFLVCAVMLLHIIASVKNREYGMALFSENGVAGIVFYLAAASAIYKLMGGPQLIPKGLMAAMMCISMLCMFLKEILIGLVDGHEDWKPEKPGEYIMQNFFECFEYILSYFSNTVSYLRLGAFVVVHASMMQVVFTLAGDVSSVKGIIVVIIGNIVVMGLEALLTGIQALRLEFYEMFSRFYKGEGRPFETVNLKSKIKYNSVNKINAVKH